MKSRAVYPEKGIRELLGDKDGKHSVQEKAQKEIANDLHIDTSFLPGVSYPRDLDTNVKKTVDELMETYERDIARLKA